MLHDWMILLGIMWCLFLIMVQFSLIIDIVQTGYRVKTVIVVVVVLCDMVRLANSVPLIIIIIKGIFMVVIRAQDID